MEAQDLERRLIEAVAECADDPEAFVWMIFPWGKKGTALADSEPRDWQLKELRELGEQIRACPDKRYEAIQRAIASGHGIGKSALVCWIIWWALSTCVDAKGVVTANTENQLKTKTWAELAKWHRLALNSDWFVYTATSLFSSDPKHQKTWRMDMVPWSENNTEAFAGLHNVGKRILLIFDEASAIPDVIWEVSEGALTDENTEIIWAVFGNPTRNTGRFKDCFAALRHRWKHKQIDSRDVEGTNKQQLQNWIDDYGEDSDFVRVRVKGEFPRQGDSQFIASDVVEAANKRQVAVPIGAPKLLGVDVARFGSDQTVFARRHGRKCEPLSKYQGLNTMEVADLVVKECVENKPDVVLIDGVGLGAGVVDRVRQLGIPAIEVLSGGKPDKENQDVVYNKRAEMWYRMRDWLDGADLPNDKDLSDDLIGIEYAYDNRARIQLEKKSEMKKRGLASPDCADALALTFAYATPPIKSTSSDLLPDELPDY